MLHIARIFLIDDSGATAIEYGLIAALICVALLGGAKSAGFSVNALWNNNAQTVGDALANSQ
ncbi:Flp family type IVb pilin [Mesorhizobium denitrificans]|uniref:Flp family type IVb pilin n=2 Tax=Phyllobacteriaceae TaxID=69277 RepID=A0A371XFK4_9HYPH|nr:Flp family type IVb pilin [Mesorhizobium denitrificans]